MKIFFGGQIKDTCRGCLAALVSVNLHDETYATYVYPSSSEEFNNLTGLRALSYPLTRVYMGISREAGESILSNSQNRGIKEVNLDDLDRLVVSQYFIDNDINPIKPKRIVLESTEESYKVADVG